MADYFEAKLALNSETGNVVPGAEADVYAFDDTGFTTPLAITDLQDVPLAKLIASPTGIYPPFKVVGEPTRVLAKSGPMVTPLTSVTGTKGAKGDPGDPADPSLLLPDPESLPNGYVAMVVSGVWSAGPAPSGSGGSGVTLYYSWNGTAYVDSNGATPPTTKPAGEWLIREFLTKGDPLAPFPTDPTWPGVEDRWRLPEAA